MIKVTIGNNVKRKTVILDENTSLRQALEDAEIDYTRGTMNFDGSSLSPGDLDKTFAATLRQITLRCLAAITFRRKVTAICPTRHIQHYGCIGGYASRFAEYMYNRDYVGAIDQAAVSARNLNFHD